MGNEIVLGSKVIIKECHSLPQIIGKTGVVRALMLVDEENKYPLLVILDEPIKFTQETPIPGLALTQDWRGPHYCRPEELTLVGSAPETKGNIPDYLIKDFEDKPKDEPNAGH